MASCFTVACDLAPSVLHIVNYRATLAVIAGTPAVPHSGRLKSRLLVCPCDSVSGVAGQTCQRKRILIVDDEEMILRALARVLGREHDTTTLTSADEALRRLMSGDESWDVIISDVRMPVMDGVEFTTRAIRACPELVGRIILMTGGTAPTKLCSALGRDAPMVIAKPVQLEDLQRLLAGISSRTEATSAPARDDVD